MKALLIFLFIGLSAAGFLSCTQTRYVQGYRTFRDTVFRDRYRRDSIFVRDSVTIRQKGDTVFLDRDRILYRDRLIRDTVYRYSDKYIEVPVEVEKELSKVDNFFIGIGKLALAALMIFLFYFLRMRR